MFIVVENQLCFLEDKNFLFNILFVRFLPRPIYLNNKRKDKFIGFKNRNPKSILKVNKNPIIMDSWNGWVCS
jgi:hypothetical protein